MRKYKYRVVTRDWDFELEDHSFYVFEFDSVDEAADFCDEKLDEGYTTDDLTMTFYWE